jgi:3-keto-L-gulonate-6-phosphate decarboxylase
MRAKLTVGAVIVVLVVAAIVLVACETPGERRAIQYRLAEQAQANAQVQVATEQRLAAQAQANADAAAARAEADAQIHRQTTDLQVLIENNAQEIRRLEESQSNFEKRLVMLVTVTGGLTDEQIKELRDSLKEPGGLTPVQRLGVWLVVVAISAGMLAGYALHRRRQQ